SCPEQQLLALAARRKCLGFLAVGFGLNAKALFKRDRLLETSSLHDALLSFVEGGSPTGALITGNCPKDLALITKGYARLDSGATTNIKFIVAPCRNVRKTLLSMLFLCFERLTQFRHKRRK